MKGFGFVQHGGMDRLTFVDVPEPRPQAQEIRLDVGAAAFNRLDRFVLEGIPGVSIELPHVLGSDAAGTVDAVGKDVVDTSPGETVLINPGLSDGTCKACLAGIECYCRQFQIVGEHVQGSCAPFLVVPRSNVHRIPRGLSLPQAASMSLVFQTVWRALRTVASVQPGELVAIIGAGGGTAPAALQVAKAAGAKVVVVTRSREKASRSRELGADEVLVESPDEPLDKLLWKWSEKKGVDVIFDSVGAPTLPRSLRALARGGRVVVIGATAGPMVQLDIRTLFWRQSSIRGSTMSTRREFEAMLTAVARGELKPVIDSVYPFAEAEKAFRRFAAADTFGKVVVTLD